MTVVVWAQVAGTNVYEEKKEESLKIMKESDTKVPPPPSLSHSVRAGVSPRAPLQPWPRRASRQLLAQRLVTRAPSDRVCAERSGSDRLEAGGG